MPTLYTPNGLESVIDSYDSGTSTVAGMILDLDHSQTGQNRKGMVVINGTFTHTQSANKYFIYQLRNTNSLSGSWNNTGVTSILEGSGTTSVYRWSGTTYYNYMNWYQITSNRQFAFSIYLDLRENGTSSPYQRMHYSCEGVCYTTNAMRSFTQTSSRVLDDRTVNGIGFLCSGTNSFKCSATAYALAGGYHP